MLDLSTENKALCFEDSTLKPLYIFLYYWQEDSLHQNGGWWQYFTTIDEAIILESAETTEGVLEGNNFELGSFVVPSIKVQWQNNGIRYKDMVAVPVQKIGNEYIAYFDGYISSEEISQDGQTVSAEIVSFIGERLDIDVLETVKGYSGGTLYEIIQSALSQTAGIWVYGSETDELLNKFKNANTIINLNTETLPQTLTANELLKQAGEFLGGHIVVKEKRVVDIDNMKTYQPSAMPIIDFIRFSNVDMVAQSNIKPLPSGFKRLPYVQFSGNQYINTGVKSSETISAKYQVITDEINSLGSHILSSENLWFPFFSKVGTETTYIWWNWFGTRPSPYIKASGYYSKKTFSAFENDKVFINGISYSATKGNETPTGDLYLGTYGGAVNDTSYALKGKVFYCQIFDNETLVRDLVPCIRTEDYKVGFYDFVYGTFYLSNGAEFVSPKNYIETYTLPYYINLYADKTNRVKFDQIRVVTETGDSESGQRNFTFWWNDDVKTTYEIKNNIFFEALSSQYWQYCQNAVREVGSYLAEQNLYYADLQTVYPPFIEGGDYLIVKGKNQIKLPSGYFALDNIEIGKNSYIDTNIFPDSDNIEIDLEFSSFGGYCHIFGADGRNSFNQTLLLYSNGNNLTCLIGYYGGSIQLSAFKIDYIPENQKININIKCGKGNYEYSGVFNGSGGYHGDYTIYTKDNSIVLGSLDTTARNYKLYHFAYSQGGVKLCDMYPCIRQSDGAIGVYDIVQNAFRVVQGNSSPNYESADTVIPVLSTTARGIHSMRADILCKATNTNKN